MADVARLLQAAEDHASAISAIGTDTSAALAAIRTAVDQLRAIVANDPNTQSALDSVAAGLEAGTLALQDTDAAIRAAGDDPGSPVPPVPEPEPAPETPEPELPPETPVNPEF